MRKFLANPSKVFATLGVLMLALVVYVVFTTLPAQAQTATSATSSEANNTANQVSASGAIAAGGSVTNNFPSQPARTTTKVQQDGTATLKTAPALGGLALGGGHPCALSPMTGQISIIGGGLGYGGMEVDEACMLAVMGAATGDAKMYNAAIYMMAARDQDACEAMYIAGLVSDCKRNGRSLVRNEPTKATPTFSTRNAAAPVKVEYSKCEKTANNTVKIKYKYGADKVAAKAMCLAALGY